MGAGVARPARGGEMVSPPDQGQSPPLCFLSEGGRQVRSEARGRDVLFQKQDL